MQCQTDTLFADRRVVGTVAVAHFAGISQDTARAWAWALRVARVRGGFAWTRDDVDRLADFLAAGSDTRGVAASA